MWQPSETFLWALNKTSDRKRLFETELDQHIESTKQKQDASLVNITKRCELRISYTSTFDIPSWAWGKPVDKLSKLLNRNENLQLIKSFKVHFVYKDCVWLLSERDSCVQLCKMWPKKSYELNWTFISPRTISYIHENTKSVYVVGSNIEEKFI